MRDEIELSVREIFEKEEFPLENLMNSALDRYDLWIIAITAFDSNDLVDFTEQIQLIV